MAMFDKAKLNRGQQDGKKPAAKPHEQAPAPADAAKAPDMPALGAAGPSAAPGLGSKVDAAEGDKAAQAEQQKELARVKSLPPGDPELEKFKDPEAMAAQVPEGAGAGGSAEADAKGMSPKEEKQGDATVGPSAQQVSAEPGGAGINVQEVQTYESPPVTGPVAEATKNASGGGAEATAPTEKAVDAGAEAAQDKVAAEPAEVLTPEAPQQLNTEAPGGQAPAVADAAPPTAPVAAAEQPKTGDASAEGRGGKEPEKAPEAQPKAPSGGEPGAPKGEVAAAPDAGALEGEKVAPLAVAAGAPAPAPDATIREVQGAAPAVAAGNVADALPGGVAAAPEGAPAAPAAATDVAPKEGGAAPAGGEPAKAPDQALEQAPVAQPVAEAGPVAPAEAAAGAPASTTPAAVAAGGAPAPAPAAGAEVAPAASENAVPALEEKAGEGAVLEPSVTEEKAPAGPTDAGGGPAPAAAGGGAPAPGPNPIDAAATSAPGGPAPAAVTGLAEVVADTTLPELRGAAGDVGDRFGGRTAAAELGTDVFGLTADTAAAESLLPPAGMNADALSAIQAVGEAAGLDPNVEVASEVSDRTRQVEELLGAKGEQAKADITAGAGDAANKKLGDLKQSTDDFKEKASGALDDMKGLGDQALKDLGGKAEKKLANLSDQFKSDPSTSVKGMLGEGKELGGGIRQKAEAAVGKDLGDLRVHGGDMAKELADGVGATAFAQGKDIVLGSAAQLTGKAQDTVMAEEIAHTQQVKGDGGKGVPSAMAKAEKAARGAAMRVLEGASIKGLEAEDDAVALYRNTGGGSTPSAGGTAPTQVVLNMGGKSVTVKLPTISPGTTSKQVSLPALGIQGLTIKSMALMRFDATSSAFKGGIVDGQIKVGQVMNRPVAKISIAENGTMTSSFANTPLKVGSLIDGNVTATVASAGVTGQGEIRHGQLKGDKLGQWLKSGTMSVSVSAEGNVTGSGSLGFEIETFTAGTLAATIENNIDLVGKVDIANKKEIALPPKSTISDGALTGQLTGSNKVELSGDLKLTIETLGGGEGKLAAKWDSDSTKISGDAALTSLAPSLIGKANITKSTVTGAAADTKLDKVDGSGDAVFDDLFDGQWNGFVDLPTERATFTLGGKLAAPITKGEVTVENGSLTIQVDAGELTSTSGNVDFKLSDFLKGTAVLEEGTNKNNINATATAELVNTQTFDGITLSKGSITVKVTGTKVEVVSGSVDMSYRDVAKGQLNLSASANYRKFNGNGKATLNEGLVWGDIKVKSGDIDVAIKASKVDTAQGQMTMSYLDIAEGPMSFNAKDDFNSISGTSVAHLVATKDLAAPLVLQPDEGKNFDLRFEHTVFKGLKGAFAWKAEKFSGDVTQVAEVKEFGLITGQGKADLNEDLPIGTVSGGAMVGKQGSTLTGKITSGQFQGIKGELKWQYQEWLEGMFNIPAFTPTIHEMNGMVDAKVIAKKSLPNNDKVEIQPGSSTLKVELTNSVPKRYSGTLDFIYDSYLKGSVTVTGPMLDFSNLAGKSSAEVIAPKTIKNVEVLPGSSMNVEFVSSNFDAFDGAIKYNYNGWLEGNATATAGGGSSVKLGVSATDSLATIKSAPPGNTGKLKILPDSAVKVDLAPNTEVTKFKAGSSLKWQYETWIGGDAMALTHDALINSPSETTTAKLLEPKQIGVQPTITLLPSEGVTAIIAGGSVDKLSGSVEAKIEDWMAGKLVIGENSTVNTFNGDLIGNILTPKQVGSSDTYLDPGGPVTVKVRVNRGESMSGAIPVKYGAKKRWLQGTVQGKSTSDGIKSLNGAFTGSVIEQMPLAGGKFIVEPGGSPAGAMTASAISKLTGDINFTASTGQYTNWLGGKVGLTEASTKDMMSGPYTGSIKADLGAGVDVTVKSGTAAGDIDQNAVKNLGGNLKLQYGTLLEATITAEKAEPQKIGGEGPGKFLDELAVVPDKLFITRGGSPTVKFVDGKFDSFSGEVNWRWEKWVSGTATVTRGTKDDITVSAAHGSIVKEKKINDDIMLLPGGSFDVVLTKTGVDDFTGSANIEFGKANPGTSWHTGGTIALAAAKLSSLKGVIDGRLKSEKKYPPSLVLKKGGSAKFDFDVPSADSVKSVTGSVDYGLNKGETEKFIEGTLAISAEGSKISGALTGRVVKGQNFDDVKILEGGSLRGRLVDSSNATLGGNLEVQYKEVVKGSLTVDGQIDPKDPKVNGKIEGSLIDDVSINAPGGKIVLNKGSAAGAKLTNSALDQFWGKLAFSTQPGDMPPIWPGQFSGSVEVPEGSNSKPDDISGVATAKYGGVGGTTSGIIMLSADLTINVEHNEFKQLSGTATVAYQDLLFGTLTLQSGSTLTSLSGLIEARLGKRVPVLSTFALMPGGAVRGTIANNELTGVGGSILWEYGEGGWLGGDITVPDGTTLEQPSGSGTATVKSEKKIAGSELSLLPGGSLTVQVAGGDPTSFGGKVLWAYGNDKWLDGDVTIAEGSMLDSISGSATAKLAKDKPLGGELTLKQGGHLTLQMVGSAPGPFDGEVNWEYQDWLEGKLTATGALFESIQGDATASIKKEHEVSPGLELQKGGAAQVHVDQDGIQEFGGSVNWKYGEGERWIEGSVTIAGKSSFDSISGKADAKLLKDLQFTDLKVLAEGSHAEVTLEGGAIKTFGGSVTYLYGADEWLKGTVTVNPTSTKENISGDATGEFVKDKLVDGSELTLKTGSSGKATMEASAVKTLSGTLNWEYGADPWLKGTITVADGSTPDKVTGKVSASLMKNYILSEKVSLGEGGNLTADYDGQGLKNYTGEVIVLYEDWLQGTLTLNNANLDDVTGSLEAKLILDKALDDKVTLKRGGAVKVEMANNSFTSFTGDVSWQYENWLGGTINVTAGTETTITGEGSATILEAKTLGEGGKFEIQRGSSLQAKVTGNNFDGVGGAVAWRYESWLKGSVTVPAYTEFDKVSGTIDATLIDNKDVGSEIVLKTGGTMKGELKDGGIDKISGNVEWKYQDWLGGSVTLDPSSLDHLTGKAEAHVIKRKEVKPPFTVERGGSIQVDFDTAKAIGDQPFSANLAFEYEGWLGGEVQVDAGSTFNSLTGSGRAMLKTEKEQGEITLRRGGEVRVEVKDSAPDSFGGDLNLQYQTWLAGTVNIKDGSKLDSISGQVTASVVDPKKFGDVTLKTGGSIEANVEGSDLTTFGGTAYLNWKEWFDIELDVDKASTKDSITGKGTATLAKNYPVGGSPLEIVANSSASVDIAASDFAGVTGELKWKYENWAEGEIGVQASKLDAISGEAKARIIEPKPLPAKMQLLPGGHADVTVANNDLQQWGGTVNWQYDDLLKGSLAIEGKTSLDSIHGTAEASLMKDFDLPAGDVKLLQGSTVSVTAGAEGIEKFSGAVRFQHSDWLRGAIEATESTPDSINGHATAMVIKDFNPADGEFWVLQGGNLTTDFAASVFEGIEGQIDWEYKNPDAHVQGAITIPKSPIESISGSADAHLMEDTKEVQQTKLLAGGALKVEVAASKPDSFGGRIDWQHSNWLTGYVEVPNGTKFSGPYTGRAGASIKENKPIGDKFTLKQGGNLNLSLNTSASMEDQQIDGQIAVDYETWLRGTLKVDAGSTFKSLTGSAKVELVEDKPLGATGFVLKQGGNINAKFANNDLTNIGGTILVDYEDWLGGSIQVDENSTPTSITGKATLQLKAEKQIGDLVLQPGGDLQVAVTGNKLTSFGGAVDWKYSDWLEGNLTVDATSTFDSVSGHASAHVTNEHDIGSDFWLTQGGSARVGITANEVKTFGGEVLFKYSTWLKGGVLISGES
ncbi:MAG: DUF4157 domain-containing protein, partial [Myxococcales bacterium]|nr:DUF4157 domain-containing protein [Myxococcales bacterium]